MGTSGIKIDSTGVLEQKSDADLLAVYNDVCGTTETVLPGPRELTIERILKVLAAKRPGGKPKKIKKDKGNRNPGAPGRVHIPFDLKPKPGRRIAWAKSMRGKILEACKAGATIDQLTAITGVDRKRTYHYVRQLNADMGWGIRETDGVITVYDD